MGLSELIVGIVGSLVASILFAELTGWSPRLARAIVGLAVRRLPEDQRERMSEEWHAYLDEVPTPLSQLIASLGFLVAAERIRLPMGELLPRLASRMFGVAGFVFVLPLLVLVAMLIRLESPGPTMFRKRARWHDGREYWALTFRTMRLREDGGGVTRFGRMLRRTSLDYLPVLINIAAGHVRVRREDLERTARELLGDPPTP